MYNINYESDKIFVGFEIKEQVINSGRYIEQLDLKSAWAPKFGGIYIWCEVDSVLKMIHQENKNVSHLISIILG